MKKYEIESLKELESFAQKFVTHLRAIDTVLLRGDLGAGKTTLVQAIVKSIIGDAVEVTSPTFNLVHHYNSDKGEVYHYDLYRIEDKTELLALDIEDAIDHGLVFIEWPELAKDYLAEDYVQLDLSIGQDDMRVISMSGEGYWEKVKI